jgi:hypothetical protein
MLVGEVAVFLVLNMPLVRGVKGWMVRKLIQLNTNPTLYKLQMFILVLTGLLFLYSYNRQETMRALKNALKQDHSDMAKQMELKLA